METYQKLNTVCLFILTLIALAFVLTVTKTVLIPFVLSVFIATVLTPLMASMQNKLKINRAVVLVLTFLIFITVFLTITIFMAGSIEGFAENSNKYKDQLHNISTQVTETANSLGFTLDENSTKQTLKKLPFTKLIKSISSGLLSLFSNTFLVIIFTLFLLSGESLSTHEKGTVVHEIKTSVAKYVGTKFLTSGLTGILTFIILKSFGVEMSFMFATVTFLFNFIPTVGSIIAVLLPLPIMLLQFGFGAAFFGCLILMVAVQISIGNIIEPKFMGESVGLHPVTILLSLTFWGLLWGITGMFLSVPITATLKIIFSQFKLTEPIADAFAGKFSPI